MNISLVPAQCNIKETTFCPLTPEEFTLLQEAGLISQRKRSYRMVVHHREIQVECPILLDGKRPVGVILPAFKLPYRPYPCYVYLFAVALYLVGNSMRRAAETVQKKFGISGFSHSTISRVFSILVVKADLLATVFVDNTVDLPRKSLPGHPALLERLTWSQKKTQAAFQLFKVLAPLLCKPQLGILLVYRYFMQYCCLLM